MTAAGPRVHLVDAKNRNFGRCGRLRPEKTTEDLASVTCRCCKRNGEQDYAAARNGIDYREHRWKEYRELQADRAKARSIVAARHVEEYEVELALLRLARLADQAGEHRP